MIGRSKTFKKIETKKLKQLARTAMASIRRRILGMKTHPTVYPRNRAHHQDMVIDNTIKIQIHYCAKVMYDSPTGTAKFGRFNC